MAKCNLVDSCFFFNDQLGDMPHASEYLKDKFCKCDFYGCARYSYSELHSQDNAPNDLLPNDLFMHLLTDLPEIRKS